MLSRSKSLALFQSVITVLTSAVAIAQAQPDGLRWDPMFLETGFDGFVDDWAVFDDGSGPALYAAGRFTKVEGRKANGIARWDGRQWTEVGDGLANGAGPGTAQALCVWDDGHGPALYVGGSFDRAGSTPASRIVAWNGRRWAPLGQGVDQWIAEIETFDDGRGEALYVGGLFGTAGGKRAESIARWNGKQWEPLGAGVERPLGHARSHGVTAMAVFDDGDGPALFVGGSFVKVGHLDIPYLARWDGKKWSKPRGMNLQDGPSRFLPNVQDLQVFDDGSGPALYLTGDVAQPSVGAGLLKWDGRRVTALPGVHSFIDGYTYSMTIHDDGSGPALWVARGAIGRTNREKFSSIARWDGKSWWQPKSSPNFWVYCLISFNDGSGNALYAGGQFTELLPEGSPLYRAARLLSPLVHERYQPEEKVKEQE